MSEINAFRGKDSVNKDATERHNISQNLPLHPNFTGTSHVQRDSQPHPMQILMETAENVLREINTKSTRGSIGPSWSGNVQRESIQNPTIGDSLSTHQPQVPTQTFQRIDTTQRTSIEPFSQAHRKAINSQKLDPYPMLMHVKQKTDNLLAEPGSSQLTEETAHKQVYNALSWNEQLTYRMEKQAYQREKGEALVTMHQEGEKFLGEVLVEPYSTPMPEQIGYPSYDTLYRTVNNLHDRYKDQIRYNNMNLDLSFEESWMIDKIVHNIYEHEKTIELYKNYVTNRIRTNTHFHKIEIQRDTLESLEKIKSFIEKDTKSDIDNLVTFSAFYHIYINEKMDLPGIGEEKRKFCSILGNDIDKKQFKHVGQKIFGQISKLVPNENSKGIWEPITDQLSDTQTRDNDEVSQLSTELRSLGIKDPLRTHAEEKEDDQQGATTVNRRDILHNKTKPSEQSDPKESESSRLVSAHLKEDSLSEGGSSSKAVSAHLKEDSIFEYTDKAIEHNPENVAFHYKNLFNHIDNIIDSDSSYVHFHCDRVLDYINQAMKHNPQGINYYYKRFFEYIDTFIDIDSKYIYSYHHKVLEFTNQAMAINPDNTSIYCKNAFEYIDRAMAINPDNTSIYCKNAFEYIDRAMTINPDNTLFYNNEGLKYIDRAIEHDPKHVYYYYKKASEYIDRAIALNINAASIYCKNALEYIDRAITINPDNTLFYNNEGLKYIDRVTFYDRDYRKFYKEKIVEYIDRAIALDPSNTELYRSKASSYGYTDHISKTSDIQ